MQKILDRLPTTDELEYRRVRHLFFTDPTVIDFGDEHVAHIVPSCPHLETIVLSGVPDTSDRTIVLLAANAPKLEGIGLNGCQLVTDVGIHELVNASPPLLWVQLNGVTTLTDAVISALARSCSRLTELELCSLPMLSPLSVRDIWAFSRKLRTLRLAHCPQLTDKAFPSSLEPAEAIADENEEKPLPPRPVTWLDTLPPLILRHTADNLRYLDLAFCKISDEAIAGIVAHAPRLQTLNLSGCSSLTDAALASISTLGPNLDCLLLAHVTKITDRAVVNVARCCYNLRYVDLSFCRHLSDMAIFELSGLSHLRRLSVMRVHKLTDIALFALAEYAAGLEQLNISYCDRLSLEAIHLLLRQLMSLEYFTATGVPCMKRPGLERFSDSPPPEHDTDQQAVFRVFSHKNVHGVRMFLDKEEQRMREAESKNIPFIPRSDDSLELY